METLQTYTMTEKQFNAYVAAYQDEMMTANQKLIMMIYMMLQTEHSWSTVVLEAKQFATFCKDFQISCEEYNFIDINNITIQRGS